MQNILNIILFILCSAVIMTCTACKREQTGASHANFPPSEEGRAAVSKTLTVNMLPEKPFAGTTLQAIAVSQTGSQINYQWELNGMVLTGENSSYLDSKNHFAKGDQVSVLVTSDNTSVSASVTIKNSPPVVKSVTVKPEILYAGIDIIAEPVGYDADGDTIQFFYKWSINDVDLPDNSAVLPGDKYKRGDRIALTVIPNDSEEEGDPFISKPVVIPNGPPRFISTPPLDFKAEIYSYQAIAVDPDNDTLTYSLRTAPNGMVIDARTGLITLQIKKEHTGTHIVEIEAQDTQGLKAVQKYSLTLTVP